MIGWLDKLWVHFPVSGVSTYVFVPPLVMFVVSLLTSTGGVSGAFILLPFQVSVFGYTAPGVSATNFVYNIVSIPVGVFRFLRDGHLSRTLFALLFAGTLPGVLVGYRLHVTVLADPARFRVFAGVILGLLGLRVVQDAFTEWRRARRSARPLPVGSEAAAPASERIVGGRVGWSRTSILTTTGELSFPTAALVLPSLLVGVAAGAYGIGGGAVLAPLCVSVLRLPPFAVAGATLLSTWVTSVFAALVYAFMPTAHAALARPDWLLGMLFGLGGMAGIYLGARLQRRVPPLLVKAILGATLIAVAVRYL